MSSKSPIRVVEFFIYIVIIVTAIVFTISNKKEPLKDSEPNIQQNTPDLPDIKNPILEN